MFPIDIDQLLRLVTPEVHAGLRRAVELGKWHDGTPLTREQRELCLQALIAYESRRLAPEERVGYIDRGSKRDGEQCDADRDEPDVVRIVRDGVH